MRGLSPRVRRQAKRRPARSGPSQSSLRADSESVIAHGLEVVRGREVRDIRSEFRLDFGTNQLLQRDWAQRRRSASSNATPSIRGEKSHGGGHRRVACLKTDTGSAIIPAVPDGLPKAEFGFPGPGRDKLCPTCAAREFEWRPEAERATSEVAPPSCRELRQGSAGGLATRPRPWHRLERPWRPHRPR